MATRDVALCITPFEHNTRAETQPSRTEQPAPPLPTETATTIVKQDDVVEPVQSDGDGQQWTSLSLLSEFERLFNNFDYENIREEILNRHLIECRFYTVLWRIFLRCLPRDPSQWIEVLSVTRNQYSEYKQKYDIDPRASCPENGTNQIVNHPLSQHPDSDWRRFHDNKEFKQNIEVDVRRTYPHEDFFRTNEIIKLQIEVLFIHARHHAGICDYRQGMHEILGMIIYTMHLESQRVYADPDSNQLMRELYNPAFLRHDSYAIFEKIMIHVVQYYTQEKTICRPLKRSTSIKDTKQRLFEDQETDYVEQNPNVLRMKSLFDRLEQYDPALYAKLKKCNTEPTVYGIRWLRLMFGREIPFRSIPILWNIIFSFDDHFSFVDHLFITLLMEIGQLVLRAPHESEMEFLHILMKPNLIVNVEPVIRRALRLAGRQIQLSTESAIAQPMPPTPEEDDRHEASPLQGNASGATPKIQRVRIPPQNNPRLTRPHASPNLKKTSTETRINGGTKPKVTHPSSSNSRSVEDHSEPLSTIDMEMFEGKTARQQYEENVRLQQCCAQYMSKFVGELERFVCELQLGNEKEVLITIGKLKQIVHLLDGSLTLDDDVLQDLKNA